MINLKLLSSKRRLFIEKFVHDQEKFDDGIVDAMCKWALTKIEHQRNVDLRILKHPVEVSQFTASPPKKWKNFRAPHKCSKFLASFCFECPKMASFKPFFPLPVRILNPCFMTFFLAPGQFKD